MEMRGVIVIFVYVSGYEESLEIKERKGNIMPSDSARGAGEKNERPLVSHHYWR